MTTRLMKRIRGLDRHLEAEDLLQKALDEQRAVNQTAFRLALVTAMKAEEIEHDTEERNDGGRPPHPS